MTSTCISSCVKDARVPVRATYVNLYKWPESDVEFIRSLSSDYRRPNNSISTGNNNTITNPGAGAGPHQHPKVVDSISCRQLYLRSYTFSRDVTDDETTRNSRKRKRRRRTRSKSREENNDNNGGGGGRRRRRKCEGIRRAKEASCAALAAIFRRLLYCTTKIDVVR